jgi:hypothetical protein
VTISAKMGLGYRNRWYTRAADLLASRLGWTTIEILHSGEKDRRETIWTGCACQPWQGQRLWASGGDWGRENRFYLFTAFCDGSIAADIEVTKVSHFRRLDGANIHDETRFEVHNKGSDAPVEYFIYMAWSDPINV